MGDERWVDIPGCVGRYMVSDLGRIKSLPRKRTKGGIRKTSTAKGGYVRIDLRQDTGKRSTSKYVHHLVMESFNGPRPSGNQVAHLNGDPSDNRLCNLRYVTKMENERHKKMHGTHLQGENTPSSKLVWSQVCEIRRLKGEIMQEELANRFGVARTTIQRIQAGQTWKSQN